MSAVIEGFNVLQNPSNADNKSAFSVLMEDMLRLTREAADISFTSSDHANERQLCNFIATGKRSGIDDADLDVSDKRLLAAVRSKNDELLVRGKSYEDRKFFLRIYAAEYRVLRLSRRIVNPGRKDASF